MELAVYHREILKLASLNKKSEDLKNFNFSHKLKNPLCGDEVTVKLNIENKKILQISANVRGCALCEASGGLVVKIFKNKNIPIENFLKNFQSWLNDNSSLDSRSLPLDLKIFSPVKTIKNRHTCVLMPFDATFRSIEK